jgi:trimethylamine--corrinoid protein Co-methyltransferase
LNTDKADPMTEDIILPQLNMLPENAVTRIHEASLDVLNRVGVRVEDPVMREQLSGSGCAIEKERVKFPPDFIQEICAGICRIFTLNYPPGTGIELGSGNALTHPTGGMPFVLDLETGKRRLGRARDLINMTQLINKLDQIDINCAMLFLDDVPAEINEIKQCEILLRYSRKPVYILAGSENKARYIVELFREAAGPINDQLEGQKGLVGISPESPLNFPQSITDVMRVIISAGLPAVMLPAPLVGFTAPMTLAGGLVQQNASMLAFTAMASRINPATMLIYGARLAFANMRTGNSIWGLPNVAMAGAYAVQLADYYGFVSDVYGLSCSSCTHDTQAGYEKMANGLLPLMAGAGMISGLGGLASLTVASYEQLVIDNEIMRVLRKMVRGIKLNKDTLAVNVIAAAAEDQSYLLQEHTLKYLRNDEVFIPDLGFDDTWDAWENQNRWDIRQKAGHKVRQLLDSTSEELQPYETGDIFDSIMSAAHAELVKCK